MPLEYQFLMESLSGNLTGLRELYDKSKAFNATDEMINAQDGTGQSALFLSIRKGNMDSAEFILNHGADVNLPTRDGNIPLIVAIKKGFTQFAELIIQRGADVNASTDDGNTPLIEASARGYIPLIKKLIERGARIDASQKDGTNAPYKAAQNGHLDVLKLLIQIHPNIIDLQGYKGQTPFIAAVKNGHPYVAEYLFSVQWNTTLSKGKVLHIT